MPLPDHLPASVILWGLLTWGVTAKQEAKASLNMESKGGMLRPGRTKVWLNASKRLKGSERVLLMVLSKQRAFRKCQGWAGPLGILGHSEAPRKRHGAVPGQPFLFSGRG